MSKKRDRPARCNRDAYCFRPYGHFGGCTPEPTDATKWAAIEGDGTGTPLPPADGRSHTLIHSVDCWCDPLRLKGKA